MVNCWNKPLRGAGDPPVPAVSRWRLAAALWGMLLLHKVALCASATSWIVQGAHQVQSPGGDNLIISATLNTCDILLEKVLLLCGFCIFMDQFILSPWRNISAGTSLWGSSAVPCACRDGAIAAGFCPLQDTVQDHSGQPYSLPWKGNSGMERCSALFLGVRGWLPWGKCGKAAFHQSAAKQNSPALQPIDHFLYFLCAAIEANGPDLTWHCSSSSQTLCGRLGASPAIACSTIALVLGNCYG